LLVIAIWSCNSKKVESENTNDSVKSNVEAVRDTVAVEEISKDSTKTVDGKVLEINNGIDGYTAKIETKDKEIYYVTISISNLKNHEQYKSVKVGEALNVTGDYWKTEADNQITVRVIN
jgi:hypothetical protein